MCNLLAEAYRQAQSDFTQLALNSRPIEVVEIDRQKENYDKSLSGSHDEVDCRTQDVSTYQWHRYQIGRDMIGLGDIC